MINKICYTILLFSTCCLVDVYAQTAFLEVGLGNTNFKNYVNSSGERNTINENTSNLNTYYIEFGLGLDFWEEKLGVNGGLNYSNYSITTDERGDHAFLPIEYYLSYMGVKLGVDVKLIDWGDFELKVNADLGHDWMLNGTSSFNDKTYNLYQNGNIDPTVWRFYRGLVLDYKISNIITVYYSYNLATSFKETNKDTNNGEEYIFKTKLNTLGLVLNLKN